MSKPLIAIAWPKPDYVTALERAGADVRELSPDATPLSADFRDCDGLLLTGGPDVDPREYGETERLPNVNVDAVRDAYELALARNALARDLPLFAICRGVQLLNVAAGGTLFQDLPAQHPSELRHSLKEPPDAIAHDVSVPPTTCLSALLHNQLNPTGHLAVNSRHHQAVRETAPGFVVSAMAPDGVTEAIERPGALFCVGVQWHPENFWASGQFSTLFCGLVDAARKYRDERQRT